MEIRLQKWGNSLGIRIPSSFIKSLGLKDNDVLKLDQIEDRIVITKSIKPTISLAERFANYNGKNLAKDFEWDDPVGREVW